MKRRHGGETTLRLIFCQANRAFCDAGPYRVELWRTLIMNQFEEIIGELTAPINDQLPRPWMTDMKDPQAAEVFIVGMNQRNPYPAKEIPHSRHLDALFNRNGESCRALYDEVTKGKPSRTRRNTDGLTARLKQRNVHSILETDVVCFSTPLGRDLRQSANVAGAKNGEEIFRYLLTAIAPKALIIHGAGSVKRASRILSMNGLCVPSSADEICDVQTSQHVVIPIPTLAPPGFNMWSSWSEEYLDRVADRVHDYLAA